jgi:NAD(P)-dependent dehydrogenase (short-subunit alcohol dehydrogenase family)
MSEPYCEPYAATKGGMLALTHALAMSLGQNRTVLKQGEANGKFVVRVNSICPGWIDVPSHNHTLADSDHSFHPAGRVGAPRDIANMCLFLADSEKSGFITGQNFVVDGGVTKKMTYDADFTTVGTK